MTKRVEVYPKVTVTLTVPDDFDATEWLPRFTLTAMRVVRDRLRGVVAAHPGVVHLYTHIHHADGAVNE